MSQKISLIEFAKRYFQKYKPSKQSEEVLKHLMENNGNIVQLPKSYSKRFYARNRFEELLKVSWSRLFTDQERKEFKKLGKQQAIINSFMSDICANAELTFNKKWKIDLQDIENTLRHYLENNYFTND